MRLPWLQIDADGMTRGEMLGRLLCVGPDGGIGLALRLWRWALEMAPEGDFSGGIYDVRALAAGVGWDPADAEKLVAELVTVGLAKAIGTKVRVKGLDRYRKSFEENEAKRARWRRGNENRKDAAVNSAVTARLPLPETETETERKAFKDLAGKKPAEPKTPKHPKPEKPPNPRHTPLVEALDATYREVMLGARLGFDTRDAAAVVRLLAKSPDNEEILFRWRSALEKSSDKFWTPKTRTLFDLVRDWAAYPCAKPDTPRELFDPEPFLESEIPL